MAQIHHGDVRTHDRAAHQQASTQLKLLTLATQAAEQASLLMVMLDTYMALEKLIRHERNSDAQALIAKREGFVFADAVDQCAAVGCPGGVYFCDVPVCG